VSGLLAVLDLGVFDGFKDQLQQANAIRVSETNKYIELWNTVVDTIIKPLHKQGVFLVE